MTVEKSRPEGHWDWVIDLPYSMGAKVNNLVFVGGQVPLDTEGKVLHSGDIVAQTRITMDNVKIVLESLGATMDDVVKINAYYVGDASREAWEQSASIRASYFKKPGPVATGLPLPALATEGMMIEVEVIAVIPD